MDRGCIPELVNLVRNGSPSAQEVAAAGLAKLAEGGTVDRLERRAKAELKAKRRAERAAEAARAARGRRLPTEGTKLAGDGRIPRLSGERHGPRLYFDAAGNKIDPTKRGKEWDYQAVSTLFYPFSALKSK